MRMKEYSGEFPPIPKDLLEHLEKIQDIKPLDLREDPQRALVRHAYSSGARALVQVLREHYDAQNETIPED